MQPDDNTSNPPRNPHSPEDSNSAHKPAPPPGVVAGALAICAAFVVFGFGCYFAFRWLCRTRAREAAGKKKKKALPPGAETPVPLTTWGYIHSRAPRGRGNDGDDEGGRGSRRREESV
ncbi:hypothetical protein CkaCkLH20_12770 [Colletotrichum karsti]|uniref:Uncharacterized protein n=1 Tax=Colletotrichum karsti TaxID=1095194 RepID=A0A9P6HS84_9PEZI|nr:uncharacterized protein CkaCkLH20_12770 [Colletotrichum karsti]KAF9869727.1 hypothetical protein CkaCkLH20_12770 [Colletotrichum karsti]